MINSTQRANNKKRDNNQASFHASLLLFLLYTIYHNAQAAVTLPSTAANVRMTASKPIVCNPLITTHIYSQQKKQ